MLIYKVNSNKVYRRISWQHDQRESQLPWSRRIVWIDIMGLGGSNTSGNTDMLKPFYTSARTLRSQLTTSD